MPRISQDPTEPAFVQDPYPHYARMRALGPLVFWEEYRMPCATTNAAVMAVLKHRGMGRERRPALEVPARLAPFYAIEAHSMLELEPPRHTRLRGLVLRAFTSRRVGALRPEVATLCDALIDAFPEGPFDLLPAYCTPIPVTVIARLLGVPDADAPDLLRWSTGMVGMYQAGRTRAMEDAAVAATAEFVDYLRCVIAVKRRAPKDDLLSELIAARDGADRLSEEEMVTTAILLLNAGHEATVHALGNAVARLLADGWVPGNPARAAEEALRFDPPLHLFTRQTYEDVVVEGIAIPAGTEVAALLASAGRDPAAHDGPDGFDPERAPKANAAFGGGIHFCVGAPLARLEIEVALERLFARRPALRLAGEARYAPIYHFHGLAALPVRP
ncbi:cytochrome P450 [Hasllibacter halocynthiae]|nr:cytochrome P450 [Hasllibacter halocynthiae]